LLQSFRGSFAHPDDGSACTGQAATATLTAASPGWPSNAQTLCSHYNSRRNQIVALTARAGIPVSFEFREFVVLVV